MDSSEADQEPRELSDYVLSAVFPECVTITHGKHTTKSVQISRGDIIVLKSCLAKVITLTYRDEASGRRKDIDVPLDFPHKFMVLPPKEVSSGRAVSVIMYPSVSDLLIDSPTYFEATSSCDNTDLSDLHGTSIKRGERFRFGGVVVSPEDGRKTLKAMNEAGDVVFLSMECRGNFYPLEDTNRYTLKELLDFAPVPRRLKLVKNDSRQSSSLHLDNTSDSCQDLTMDEDTFSSHSSNSNLSGDISGLSSNGVIHMLKPEMHADVSPMNEPDTVWTIPVTANIHVRQYHFDDYEVPTNLTSKQTDRSSIQISNIANAIEIPDFPAPPTPPILQPLIPLKANNFSEIYSNSFPVKAKLVDLTECNEYYQNTLSDYSDVTIHRIVNTRRLYAKDSKTDSVYCLSKDANVSFIEYPKKFSSISELIHLPVGSEVVVLEDIASDFPKHFSLQFGDKIKISSNTPVVMKVKHTNFECKILKCERISADKSSSTKLKLPLDFDVSMIASTDHNDQKIVTLQELLSGRVPLPSNDVAALIDNEDNYYNLLSHLPPNLQGLQVLPDKLFIATLHRDDSQSKMGYFPAQNKTPVGISVYSNVVLAFRQRLELEPCDSDRKVVTGTEYIGQQPMEVLTLGKYEERQQMSKMWTEEDEQDVESVSSNDKNSTSGDSLQRTSSTGLEEKKEKLPTKRDKDRVRRLSRVLNPKNWRASKAIPEPLPHPEAMGLMALAVRPHYEKPNEYQADVPSSPASTLDRNWSSFGVSSDEEDKNIYEDVDIRPISMAAGQAGHSSSGSGTKLFAGPFHKSLPALRNRAKRKKERASRVPGHSRDDLDTKGGKSHAGGRTSDALGAKNANKQGKATDANKTLTRDNPTSKEYQSKRIVPSDEEDDEHVYESPDGVIFKVASLRCGPGNENVNNGESRDSKPKSNVLPSHYVVPVPETKPRSKGKGRISSKTDISDTSDIKDGNVGNSDQIKSDNIRIEPASSGESSPSMQSRKHSEEPPVAPRRKKRIEQPSVVSVSVSEEKQSASKSDLCVEKAASEWNSTEDVKKGNSIQNEEHNVNTENSTQDEKHHVNTENSRQDEKHHVNTENSTQDDKHHVNTETSTQDRTYMDKENSMQDRKCQTSDSDKRLNGICNAQPPVPKPRGLKKRADLNLVDSVIVKEESLRETQPIVDDSASIQGEDIKEGPEKISEAPPASLPQKPAVPKIKPKLPPKLPPKPKPKPKPKMTGV